MGRISNMFAIACGVLLSSSAYATDIRLAVVPNSPVVDIFKAPILQAYTDINQTVSFHEMPAGRSLPLSDGGLLDGELVRLTAIEANAPNLERVPVMLASGSLVLLCRPNILCTRSRLQRPSTLVGVLEGKNIMTDYLKNMRARSYQAESGAILINMLKQGRLDYVLSINVDGFGNYTGADISAFQQAALVDFQAYHYLHKSHHSLIAPLSLALQKQLKAMH